MQFINMVLTVQLSVRVMTLILLMVQIQMYAILISDTLINTLNMYIVQHKPDKDLQEDTTLKSNNMKSGKSL